MKKNKFSYGMSLIELLVVISVFAFLGIIASTATLLTLRGARKSDSLIKVRENVNNALNVIERQLRNAEEVTCPNDGTTPLEYVVYVPTEGSLTTSFTCMNPGIDGYIASGSARLTSDEISVTGCSIICKRFDDDINNPPVVSIDIEAEEKNSQGAEQGSVTSSTEFVVRNY